MAYELHADIAGCQGSTCLLNEDLPCACMRALWLPPMVLTMSIPKPLLRLAKVSAKPGRCLGLGDVGITKRVASHSTPCADIYSHI